MANKIVQYNRRTYLKISSTVEQRSWGESFFGYFQRSPGVVFTLESFLEFDIPSEIPAGSTINSVTLEITCNTAGSQSSSVTSNLLKQNKTANSVWNGSARPPKYDDFSTTYWDTVLATQTVLGTGNYTYTSTALKNLVQDWLDSNIDWKDGIIIDAPFNSTSYYLSVDDAELDIDYTPVGAGSLLHQRRHRTYH